MMEQPPLLPEQMREPERHKTNCTRCRAEVFFATHAETGRANIFDWASDSAGNITLTPEGKYRVHTARNPAPAGATRYVSHFKNCPFASEFRA